MKNHALVSVLMPAYNHEKYVEEAIRSVWNQTYSNIEMIVIDDGSTDNTAKVIRKLVELSPIPIKFIEKNNEGICRTLNQGLALCEGEFIALLASDDYYANDFIQKMYYGLLNADLSYGCIHCDAMRVDEHGKVLGSNYTVMDRKPILDDDFLSFAYGRSRIIAGSAVFKRQVFDTVGVFDESLKAEDFDFHLRVLRKWKYIFINEPLYNARILNNSLGRSPESWINDGIIALEKHKDFLGKRYVDVIRVKELRNYRVCLLNSKYNLAWSTMIRSIKATRYGQIINTFIHIVIPLFANIFRRFETFIPKVFIRAFKIKFG